MKRTLLVILVILGIGLLPLVACAQVEVAPKEPPYTVGLSNGPFTHSWRVQMIESIQQEFEYYKEQGLVDRLIIQNAGPDVATQIAQIRLLIASGVDILLVNPNSATALNPVMEEAQEAGILVIVYDMNINNPDVLEVCMDQREWMGPITEWLCEKLNYKGDIVYISGIPDQPGDIDRNNAAMEVLAKYPDINLLAQAPGYWDQAAAQQAMSDILASFPKIDGVLTQDGMSLGIIRAFQAAGRPLPFITGETQVAFIKEWKKLKDEIGFESFGIANPPGGTICPALGIGIRLLQGKKLKPEVVSENQVVYIKPTLVVTNENLDEVYEEYKTWADAYYVNGWYSQEELDALFTRD